MNMINLIKRTVVYCTLTLVCFTGQANEDLFRQARALQKEGKFDEAIEAYKTYLSREAEDSELADDEVQIYTDALVQMMNTFQSKGEPETCITALKEAFRSSSTLQKECLRDFYSVMGYALSRTEDMKEAQETMLKAFSLPLYNATPERYFRDYAYAAAVFYSRPDYQKEVIKWCQEAIRQAQLCKNTSGKQWVTAMLGSIYKRNGDLNKALELFQESKEEAQSRCDDLGVLNSLHALIDLFLYWDIPEYANSFASEAVRVEKNMTMKNPMVSAQTYINKSRALHQLGVKDSITFYANEARKLCESLPYNSGMVDVNLLNGIYLTEIGGDSMQTGINELQEVTRQGTVINRAKAYHQLAQTYLKQDKNNMAEIMLDSLYTLVNMGESPTYIHIDYNPILNHYLKRRNHKGLDLYLQMMLKEQQAFKEKNVKFNLVEAIVGLQTEQKEQELKIARLKQTNQRLWFLICIVMSAIIISVVVMMSLRQKKQHAIQLKEADEKLAVLVRKLNESNAGNSSAAAQEMKEYLQEKENQQKLETLTPFILKEEGEEKFRQCFELLYPLFLHRLHEQVPSVSRREELLCMLIILKQDNKKIADLMAIAPRSVLMLRHRFRQKIGLSTEYSLDNFIENIIRS